MYSFNHLFRVWVLLIALTSFYSAARIIDKRSLDKWTLKHLAAPVLDAEKLSGEKHDSGSTGDNFSGDTGHHGEEKFHKVIEKVKDAEITGHLIHKGKHLIKKAMDKKKVEGNSKGSGNNIISAYGSNKFNTMKNLIEIEINCDHEELAAQWKVLSLLLKEMTKPKGSQEDDKKDTMKYFVGKGLKLGKVVEFLTAEAIKHESIDLVKELLELKNKYEQEKGTDKIEKVKELLEKVTLIGAKIFEMEKKHDSESEEDNKQKIFEHIGKKASKSVKDILKKHNSGSEEVHKPHFLGLIKDSGEHLRENVSHEVEMEKKLDETVGEEKDCDKTIRGFLAELKAVGKKIHEIKEKNEEKDEDRKRMFKHIDEINEKIHGILKKHNTTEDEESSKETENKLPIADKAKHQMKEFKEDIVDDVKEKGGKVVEGIWHFVEKTKKLQKMKNVGDSTEDQLKRVFRDEEKEDADKVENDKKLIGGFKHLIEREKKLHDIAKEGDIIKHVFKKVFKHKEGDDEHGIIEETLEKGKELVGSLKHGEEKAINGLRDIIEKEKTLYEIEHDIDLIKHVFDKVFNHHKKKNEEELCEDEDESGNKLKETFKHLAQKGAKLYGGGFITHAIHKVIKHEKKEVEGERGESQEEEEENKMHKAFDEFELVMKKLMKLYKIEHEADFIKHVFEKVYKHAKKEDEDSKDEEGKKHKTFKIFKQKIEKLLKSNKIEHDESFIEHLFGKVIKHEKEEMVDSLENEKEHDKKFDKFKHSVEKMMKHHKIEHKGDFIEHLFKKMVKNKRKESSEECSSEEHEETEHKKEFMKDAREKGKEIIGDIMEAGNKLVAGKAVKHLFEKTVKHEKKEIEVKSMNHTMKERKNLVENMKHVLDKANDKIFKHDEEEEKKGLLKDVLEKGKRIIGGIKEKENHFDEKKDSFKDHVKNLAKHKLEFKVVKHLIDEVTEHKKKDSEEECTEDSIGKGKKIVEGVGHIIENAKDKVFKHDEEEDEGGFMKGAFEKGKKTVEDLAKHTLEYKAVKHLIDKVTEHKKKDSEEECTEDSIGKGKKIVEGVGHIIEDAKDKVFKHDEEEDEGRFMKGAFEKGKKIVEDLAKHTLEYKAVKHLIDKVTEHKKKDSEEECTEDSIGKGKKIVEGVGHIIENAKDKVFKHDEEEDEGGFMKGAFEKGKKIVEDLAKHKLEYKAVKHLIDKVTEHKKKDREEEFTEDSIGKGKKIVEGLAKHKLEYGVVKHFINKVIEHEKKDSEEDSTEDTKKGRKIVKSIEHAVEKAKKKFIEHEKEDSEEESKENFDTGKENKIRRILGGFIKTVKKDHENEHKKKKIEKTFDDFKTTMEKLMKHHKIEHEHDFIEGLLGKVLKHGKKEDIEEFIKEALKFGGFKATMEKLMKHHKIEHGHDFIKHLLARVVKHGEKEAKEELLKETLEEGKKLIEGAVLVKGTIEAGKKIVGGVDHVLEKGKEIKPAIKKIFGKHEDSEECSEEMDGKLVRGFKHLIEKEKDLLGLGASSNFVRYLFEKLNKYHNENFFGGATDERKEFLDCLERDRKEKEKEREKEMKHFLGGGIDHQRHLLKAKLEHGKQKIEEPFHVLFDKLHEVEQAGKYIKDVLHKKDGMEHEHSGLFGKHSHHDTDEHGGVLSKPKQMLSKVSSALHSVGKPLSHTAVFLKKVIPIKEEENGSGCDCCCCCEEDGDRYHDRAHHQVFNYRPGSDFDELYSNPNYHYRGRYFG
nr:putative leucine-rich repeat-containing protein DDB_G0290503 [Leptinotarsa decemlineata]